jgi:hypothetical protein
MHPTDLIALKRVTPHFVGRRAVQNRRIAKKLREQFQALAAKNCRTAELQK